MSNTASKNSSSTHRSVQKSSTLSRKYVKKPQAIKLDDQGLVKVSTKKSAEKKSSPADDYARRQVRAKKIHAEKVAAMKRNKAAKTTKSSIKKTRQAKDRAIRQALKNSATEEQPTFKTKHTFRKILLATTCSALSVAALAVFVHYNMPDITVRVAAIQSGIEASYPSYIPRNYNLNNVSSSENSITMYFTDSNNNSFTLTEELSTWDSAALLSNYVKDAFSKDYTAMREQGITIYVDNGDAAWVNGGTLYKISHTGAPLTKEQIRNLATSL